MINQNISLGGCRVLFSVSDGTTKFAMNSMSDIGYTSGGSSADIKIDMDLIRYDSFGKIITRRRINQVSGDLSFTALDMSIQNQSLFNIYGNASMGSTPTPLTLAFVPLNKKLPTIVFFKTSISQINNSLKPDSEASMSITATTDPTSDTGLVFQMYNQT